MKRSTSPTPESEERRVARLQQMEQMEAAARVGGQRSAMQLDMSGDSSDRNTRVASDFLLSTPNNGRPSADGGRTTTTSGRTTTGNFFAQVDRFAVDQSVNLMDTTRPSISNGGNRRTSFVDIFIGGSGSTSGSGTSKQSNVVTTWRTSWPQKIAIGIGILACMAFLALSVPYLVTSQPQNEQLDSDSKVSIDTGEESSKNTVVSGHTIDDTKRADALKATLLAQKACDEDILGDDSSSAFQALRWLTDHDPARLDQDDSLLASRFALATFYFATHPTTTAAGRQAEMFSDWAHSSNWMSERTFCDWYGVGCDLSLKVTHMNVTGNLLEGTIPWELQSLTNLASLDLSHNRISGTISPKLFGSSNMKYFVLEDNNLEGSIPEGLKNMPALSELRLSNNKLTGTVPSGLTDLSNLQILSLGSNALVGTIPDMSGLTDITLLNLRDNGLSGEIPFSLGAMTALSDLRLDRNELTGTLPEDLKSSTEMRVLYLGFNQLEGNLPDIFDGLSKLTDLELHNNKFSGEVPKTFTSMTGLRRLTIDSNAFQGSIPIDWGVFSELEALGMHHNRFIGPIPTEFGELTNMRHAYLNHNLLQHSLPSELARLTLLRDLFLEHNAFDGTIPAQLGALTALGNFRIFTNIVTGTMPEEICELKDMNLKELEADCKSNPREIVCPCCTKCH